MKWLGFFSMSQSRESQLLNFEKNIPRVPDLLQRLPNGLFPLCRPLQCSQQDYEHLRKSMIALQKHQGLKIGVCWMHDKDGKLTKKETASSPTNDMLSRLSQKIHGLPIQIVTLSKEPQIVVDQFNCFRGIRIPRSNPKQSGEFIGASLSQLERSLNAGDIFLPSVEPRRSLRSSQSLPTIALGSSRSIEPFPAALSETVPGISNKMHPSTAWSR